MEQSKPFSLSQSYDKDQYIESPENHNKDNHINTVSSISKNKAEIIAQHFQLLHKTKSIFRSRVDELLRLEERLSIKMQCALQQTLTNNDQNEQCETTEIDKLHKMILDSYDIKDVDVFEAKLKNILDSFIDSESNINDDQFRSKNQNNQHKDNHNRHSDKNEMDIDDNDNINDKVINEKFDSLLANKTNTKNLTNVELLKKELISKHNERIKELDDVYRLRIDQLLQQKTMILTEMQCQLYQHFGYIINTMDITQQIPSFSLQDNSSCDQNKTKQHKKTTKFECNTCNKTFASKQSLEVHIRIHTGEKPFKCDICNTSYRQKSGLSQHVKSRHTNNTNSDKKYKCKICGKSYKQESGLIVHNMKHQKEDNEQKLKCKYCGKKCKKQYGLTQHINRKHCGPNKYQCPYPQCHKEFKSEKSKNSHINKKHR